MPNTAKNTSYAELTIPASGTTSNALPVQGRSVVMVALPVTTGTSFSFQVSIDNGETYQALNDASNNSVAITKTAGSETTHTLGRDSVIGVTHIKIVSGSSEAAARTIQVGMMEV